MVNNRVNEEEEIAREKELDQEARTPESPYLRAANEDDDGYDPYSDRPATPEPLFERDPWA